MSKINERVKELERRAKRDRQKIWSLEAKLEVKTRVGYGEWHYDGFSPVRAEVPIVGVVNSILRHLQLEIDCKTPSIITEAKVKLRSTKVEDPKVTK